MTLFVWNNKRHVLSRTRNENRLSRLSVLFSVLFFCVFRRSSQTMTNIIFTEITVILLVKRQSTKYEKPPTTGWMTCRWMQLKVFFSFWTVRDECFHLHFTDISHSMFLYNKYPINRIIGTVDSDNYCYNHCAGKTRYLREHRRTDKTREYKHKYTKSSKLHIIETRPK